MLFGASVPSESGTQYLAISAGSEAEARGVICAAGLEEGVLVLPFEDLLQDQYRGLAFLGVA